MDLSTIRSKLLNGEYKDPWQFCDDMWLMFENAWMYNRKASKVYKYCTKVRTIFLCLVWAGAYAEYRAILEKNSSSSI